MCGGGGWVDLVVVEYVDIVVVGGMIGGDVVW